MGVITSRILRFEVIDLTSYRVSMLTLICWFGGVSVSARLFRVWNSHSEQHDSMHSLPTGQILRDNLRSQTIFFASTGSSDIASPSLCWINAQHRGKTCSQRLWHWISGRRHACWYSLQRMAPWSGRCEQETGKHHVETSEIRSAVWVCDDSSFIHIGREEASSSLSAHERNSIHVLVLSHQVLGRWSKMRRTVIVGSSIVL